MQKYPYLIKDNDQLLPSLMKTQKKNNNNEKGNFLKRLLSTTANPYNNSARGMVSPFTDEETDRHGC